MEELFSEKIVLVKHLFVYKLKTVYLILNLLSFKRTQRVATIVVSIHTKLLGESYVERL